MEEKKVKSRRFLAKDYDFIAKFVNDELTKRKTSPDRVNHETLWKEVDRQVRMKPPEVLHPHPDDNWRSAFELGDLSIASEVLAADTLRLVFPQERAWLQTHVDIEIKRLNARQVSEGKEPLDAKTKTKIQKQADGELRALMTQQHKDFGLKSRVKLSLKEALHHGSFVVEVKTEQVDQYATGGIFKSAKSPVWTPHSMWNCYPEEGELGVNILYTGSMIITSEKSYEWVTRQNSYINLKKFKDRTSDKKDKVQLQSYYGDITVRRDGDDVFLPNMKIIVANDTVIYAKPMDNISIIYGGYDKVDVTDPYYMSPIVKQSPNQKIASIITNKFIDNVELKLDPPVVYDGNDPTLIAQGGVKIIPGSQYPSKGGAQNFKQVDVGDPSWAAEAITFFKSEVQEGTSVSSHRAGAQRQADRVTATQIENESAGAEIRTIDFVGEVELALTSFLYIQHELNLKELTKYPFFNPEMGMEDFNELSKADLPKRVHFECVGSKGVLNERRRSQGMSQTTSFLLSNERSAGLVNVEEVAKQMYMDNGVKNPERFLTVQNDNDKLQQAIQQVQQKAQEAIAAMQEDAKKIGTDLVKSEMELTNARDQLKLRGERANGVESHLRDEIKSLKQIQKQQLAFMESINKIKDQKNDLEKIQTNIKSESEKTKSTKEPVAEAPKQEIHPVVVNIAKSSGYKITRNENGDMDLVLPIEEDSEEAEA